MPEHENCPFCPERMKTREGVWTEAEHWVISNNARKYVDAETHLLITPRRHVESLLELSTEELIQLFARMIPICRTTWGEGMVVLRWGTKETTGSTVSHLHVHYIVAKPGKTVQINCGPDSRLSKGPGPIYRA